MPDARNSDPSDTNRVYIALGSNIQPEHHLPAAIAHLNHFGRVAAASTVYETLPVKFLDQANFLNAVILLETDRTLSEVFDEIVPQVERALHRVRDPQNPNGPRTIDLDVALFNDTVAQVDGHELPDPDIETRAFVGIPLAEIAPDFIHPLRGIRLADIADRFSVAEGDMRPRPDIALLPTSPAHAIGCAVSENTHRAHQKKPRR